MEENIVERKNKFAKGVHGKGMIQRTAKPKYVHCEEGHEAGNRECVRYQKEERLMDN